MLKEKQIIKQTNKKRLMAYFNYDIPSSYYKNNIGKTLYNTVLTMKPDIIIEFGTLHGYSAVAMAQALRELDSDGKIICYDLWKKYPYKNASMESTKSTIYSLGLMKYVELIEMDFYNWIPQPFDLMHFDISNHAGHLKYLKNLMDGWMHKGTVLFEGGSKERDKVEWMKDFQPINSSGINFITINEDFPSLSLML